MNNKIICLIKNDMQDRGLTTFDDMAKLKAKCEQEYEPYIKNHMEQWELK